jgi:hypothetical protein
MYMALSYRFLRDTVNIITILIEKAIFPQNDGELAILDMVEDDPLVLDWSQRVVQALRVIRGVLQNEYDAISDNNSLFDPEEGL